MFGIGLPEMIVISAVALIVVGPDKLPELARSLAKGIMEMKKTINQFKENLTEEDETLSEVQKELRQTANDLKERMLDYETKTQAHPDIDNIPNAGSEDDTDLIEAESVTRPWEQDAQSSPVDGAKANSNPPTAQGDENITQESCNAPEKQS
ncbi:Sec-independent protein translocase protein TatB [Desulfogranum japonicum]|uniref:Sec-independent protein translocase protein TatB n=1 Tax=Desulfogranum japonicum TaxID=231447 RepID=UPI0003FCF6BE|nr:Sec-independent protein translocase protein TatB [Desulfogranum japonicum]